MSWNNLGALPVARYNLCAAANKNFVYVAGGASNFAQTTAPLSILKSRIDQTDGGVGGNGPWLSCAPDMTTGKIGASMLVTGNDFLMILGGRGTTSSAADLAAAQDVFVGKLNSDGNVDRWTQTVGALPDRMIHMGTVIKDDFVYLLGGSSSKVSIAYTAQTGDFTAGQTVTGQTSGATATIASDVDGGSTGTLTLTGVVGIFVTGERLKDPLGGSAVANGAVVTTLAYDSQDEDFVVGQVVRGKTSLATGTIVSDSDAGATGTLTLSGVVGLFVNNEKLLVNHATANGALSTNFMLDYDTETGNFTVGQVVTGGTSSATGTISAIVDNGTDGTLVLTGITGVFQNAETITDPVTGSAAAVGTQYKNLNYDAETYDFSIGTIVWGATSDATGTIQNSVDAGTTGTLSLKSITGVFVDNEIIRVEKADADGGPTSTLVYLGETGNFAVGETVTGDTSAAVGIVYSDTDAGTTGTLILTPVSGTFTAAEHLTGSVGGSATGAAPTVAAVSLNTAYRARLGSDGTLGAFTALPGIIPVSGNLSGACEVVGNNVYISNTTSLFVASIGPAGLGVWRTLVPGFSKVSHKLIATNTGHLVAVGGHDGSNTIGTVFSAQATPDGETNRVTWSQTQPLRLARRLHALVKIGDRVFAIGGVDNADAVMTTVETTRVDPSGEIGGIP